MKQKLLSISSGALALALGLYLGLGSRSVDTPYPLAGQSFQTPQGTTLDLAALKGKKVVLNFWATWCPPCLEEMPELDALHHELQERQIELIGIAVDTAPNVQQFLHKRPVHYPIVLAGFDGTTLAKTLGNEQGGLPFTVILDEEGKKIFTKAGKIRMDEIRNALDR